MTNLFLKPLVPSSKKTLICLLLLFIHLETFAKEGVFTTGIGYIRPQDYRTDNEINPLPFGLSFVPIFSYKGERLSVFGPFMSYALLKGPIGFSLTSRVAGDNYEAHEVERRSTGWNVGASLRILFLSLSYGSDISNRYKGNVFNISLANRFLFFEDRLALVPRVGKQYINSGFTNYYYGVGEDEVGEFSSYSLGNAVNDVYSLNASYSLSEKNSIAINYNYKIFDNEIYRSPTISLREYSTFSAFYNYKF